MNFKFLGIILIFSVLFTACNSTKTTNLTQQNEFNQTTYYGIVPCASCPGIETWLTIKGDKYELKEQYLEEKDGLFITKGKIKKVENSNIIILEDEKGSKREFIIKNDTVIYGNKYNPKSAYKLSKTAKKN